MIIKCMLIKLVIIDCITCYKKNCLDPAIRKKPEDI